MTGRWPYFRAPGPPLCLGRRPLEGLLRPSVATPSRLGAKLHLDDTAGTAGQAAARRRQVDPSLAAEKQAAKRSARTALELVGRVR